MRERKARVTQAALEAATIDLALEVGLANVTTDQIADRADVSPRTFFNYFASKEDAVVGYSLRDANESVLDRYPERPSAAGAYVDLREFVIAHFGARMLLDDLFEKRMAVLTDNPALVRGLLTRVDELLDELVQKVALALRAAGRPDGGDGGPGTAVTEAQLLVRLCGAAVSYAVEAWRKAADGSDPIEDLREAFGLLENTAARHLVRPESEMVDEHPRS